MRFLCLYRPAKAEGTPPTQEEIAKMGKLIEEWMKSGKLLATEGCLPSAKRARVRLSRGKFDVTDGPFTEAKEVVGGFALIQAVSKEEARDRGFAHSQLARAYPAVRTRAGVRRERRES
jgi:hypothetical protein